MVLVGVCTSPVGAARPVWLQVHDDDGRPAEIAGGGRRRPLLRALQEPAAAAPAPAEAAAGAGAGAGAGGYTAEALADEIVGLLPGLSAESAAKAGRFRQFSGYLQISDYKCVRVMWNSGWGLENQAYPLSIN